LFIYRPLRVIAYTWINCAAITDDLKIRFVPGPDTCLLRFLPPLLARVEFKSSMEDRLIIYISVQGWRIQPLHFYALLAGKNVQ